MFGSALIVERDIDAYINKRWAMQVQDLIHKLTNSLNAKYMQKMHKYMQMMQNNNTNHDELCCYHFIDGYQTYTHSSKHNNLTVSKGVCRENRSKTSMSSFKFTGSDLHFTSRNRTSEIPQSFTRARLCLVLWHNTNIFQCYVTEIHGAWRPALFIWLLACTNK